MYLPHLLSAGLGVCFAICVQLLLTKQTLLTVYDRRRGDDYASTLSVQELADDGDYDDDDGGDDDDWFASLNSDPEAPTPPVTPPLPQETVATLQRAALFQNGASRPTGTSCWPQKRRCQERWAGSAS